MNHSQGSKTLESMSQAVWYNRWTLHKFQKNLCGEILEIGCGIGNFTQTLAEFGKVTAIDINKDYIKRVKSKLDGKVKIGYGNIETGEFFLNNEKFDCIVCINVLEHIKNDQLALKNVFNLLKENGYLILLVPAHKFLYGSIDEAISHFRRYEKESLRKSLEKIGFKIVSMRTLNFLGALGWFISGKIFKNRTVEERNIKIFNLFAPFFLSIENFIEPPIGTSILVIAKR